MSISEPACISSNTGGLLISWLVYILQGKIASSYDLREFHFTYLCDTFHKLLTKSQNLFFSPKRSNYRGNYLLSMSPRSCFRSIFGFRASSKRQQKEDAPRKSDATTHHDNNEGSPFQCLSEFAAPEPVQNRDENRIERHDLLERRFSNASRQ